MKLQILLLFLSFPSLAVKQRNNLSLGVGESILNGTIGQQYKDELSFVGSYRRFFDDSFSFLSQYGYSSHSGSWFQKHHLISDVGYHWWITDSFQNILETGVGVYVLELHAPSGKGRKIVYGSNIGTEFRYEMNPYFFFGTQFILHIPFNQDQYIEYSNNSVQVSGSYLNWMLSFDFVF